ncbi:MAG: acylphosphatase [Gemmataceae bacterium]
MKVAKKVFYSGRVQGVGFRYTAQRLARGYPIAGYVRNLPDGRVELVAEGEKDEVGAFLAAIRAHMARYIESEEVADIAAEGWQDFRIRY